MPSAKCPSLIASGPPIPEAVLTAWTTPNVQAGSNTTTPLPFCSARLCTFCSPARPAWKSCVPELRQAQIEGRLSVSGGRDVVTWKESRELSFLDACVKEVGRLHSPVGLTMERVGTTKDGTGIERFGTHLPEGTVVGMEPWVVH